MNVSIAVLVPIHCMTSFNQILRPFATEYEEAFLQTTEVLEAVDALTLERVEEFAEIKQRLVKRWLTSTAILANSTEKDH